MCMIVYAWLSMFGSSYMGSLLYLQCYGAENQKPVPAIVAGYCAKMH